MFRIFARSAPLQGLPALGVGIAGGTGNGLVSGLRPVYHFFQTMQMRAIDPLPSTRFNFPAALERAGELGGRLAGMVPKREYFSSLEERLLWYDALTLPGVDPGRGTAPPGGSDDAGPARRRRSRHRRGPCKGRCPGRLRPLAGIADRGGPGLRGGCQGLRRQVNRSGRGAMSRAIHLGRKNRLRRMMDLLRRFRPAEQPVTYRRNTGPPLPLRAQPLPRPPQGPPLGGALHPRRILHHPRRYHRHPPLPPNWRRRSGAVSACF